MDPQTADALVELNRRFYTEFGPAFAATRQRIQNGVRRVLGQIPDEGRWLDIGCGSGALAAAWLQAGRQSAYLGLDFSPALLAEARSAVDALPGAEQVTFAQADFSAPGWAAGLHPGGFRGALAFAVLHHLPSASLRRDLIARLGGLLAPGGLFVHSQWQFQHAARLMARVQPWERAGLRPDQLEPGDYLLDWRYTLPGQPEQAGLRYVHLFTREELASLAQETGFTVLDEFESDGDGGRLGLYQLWQKVE
jgi:tRNA (uracil-5-)-methyltransferase TRM9